MGILWDPHGTHGNSDKWTLVNEVYGQSAWQNRAVDLASLLANLLLYRFEHSILGFSPTLNSANCTSHVAWDIVISS